MSGGEPSSIKRSLRCAARAPVLSRGFKDREERTRNRLKVLNRLLNEQQDMLDSENEYPLSYQQRRNIKVDIQYFKRKIRYYEKVLKEVRNETNL